MHSLKRRCFDPTALKHSGFKKKKKKLTIISIYLFILPHALADILGRCAVEQENTEN